jgi:hypothetical protein
VDRALLIRDLRLSTRDRRRARRTPGAWHREIVEERAHLASSLKKGRDTVPLHTMVDGEEE